MKIGKTPYIVILVILVAIFLFSAWKVGSYFLDSRQSQGAFQELAQQKEQAREQAAQSTEAPQATGENAPEQEAPILPEYAQLYEQNNHLVGWIRIDNTLIDYPVMQTPEQPDYYLKRNFQGAHSDHGTIYVREACDVNAPSDNLTLYGHNMRDGSMFAPLLKYQDPAVWESNPLISFDTLREYHVYKIFAVFKTFADPDLGFAYYNMIDADSPEAFDAFISTAKALSFYDTGITPQYGDKIICLSTCEYTLLDGRFVVAAYRIS